MRFSTFYFSGTGNTAWTVRQFGKMLAEAGHEADMFSIEDEKLQTSSYLLKLIYESDYVGFANPIYGGNIPPVMRIFITKLLKLISGQNLRSKKIYIINTFGYINGFGPICAGNLFKNSPFTIFSYVNIRMCNNISRPGMKVNPVSEAVIATRKEKAKKELGKMIEKLLTEKKYITGIGPYLIPNILIRKKSVKAIADNYKELSIDRKRCKKCFLCVSKCPTKSISYHEKTDMFLFHEGCTACMRCYNHCPGFAIMFNGIYADPKEYARYHGPEEISG